MVHNSSTRVEVKFAPRSLKNLVGSPNTAMNLLYNTLVMVFLVWSFVTTANAYLVKCSVMTRMFLMQSGLFSSIIDSTLVKSM